MRADAPADTQLAASRVHFTNLLTDVVAGDFTIDAGGIFLRRPDGVFTNL